MSDPSTESAQPLQFDRAEAAPGETPRELACGVCSLPLHGHYYEINHVPTCERCRYDVEKQLEARGGAAGFLRAALFGLGAGVVGALVYYGILAATGYEVGIISIFVGWLVGTAVHKGSRGKGGWAYQTLAIALTYLAIVSTYIPLIWQGLREAEGEKAAPTSPAKTPKGAPAAPESPRAASALGVAAPTSGSVSGTASRRSTAPSPKSAKPSSRDEEMPTFVQIVGAFGVLLLLGMIAPFLQGARSVIGLLIIFFGLYQAWKLNRKNELVILGPFSIRAAPAVPAE